MKRKHDRLILHLACLLAAVFAVGMLFERVALTPALSPALAAGEPEPVGSSEPVIAAPPVREQTEKPEFDPNDWKLKLVNRWTPLPADFAVETVEVERGYRFDARAADKLTAMLDGCRAAGLHPLLCSAWRSADYQTGLFARQVRKQQSRGLNQEDAVRAAGEVVAVPGTSEHELGLAVDICSLDYQLLDEGQEQTAECQWLREHCAEYGFILRYPPDTTEITGIIYEPWHFRYVGEEAAAYIMRENITLEQAYEIER